MSNIIDNKYSKIDHLLSNENGSHYYKNIGIKNKNPQYDLDVNGVIRAEKYLIKTDDNKSQELNIKDWNDYKKKIDNSSDLYKIYKNQKNDFDYVLTNSTILREIVDDRITLNKELNEKKIEIFNSFGTIFDDIILKIKEKINKLQDENFKNIINTILDKVETNNINSMKYLVKSSQNFNEIFLRLNNYFNYKILNIVIFGKKTSSDNIIITNIITTILDTINNSSRTEFNNDNKKNIINNIKTELIPKLNNWKQNKLQNNLNYLNGIMINLNKIFFDNDNNIINFPKAKELKNEFSKLNSPDMLDLETKILLLINIFKKILDFFENNNTIDSGFSKYNSNNIHIKELDNMLKDINDTFNKNKNIRNNYIVSDLNHIFNIINENFKYLEFYIKNSNKEEETLYISTKIKVLKILINEYQELVNSKISEDNNPSTDNTASK